MCDAGVGEHALHVLLRQRQHVADDHRHRGKHPGRVVPRRVRGSEPVEQQPCESGERCGLHAGRHERSVRCRRTFVHIRRPHVKRDGCNLEREAHEQQCQSAHQQWIRAEIARLDDRGHLCEVRRAGRAVHQRHAVQQEASRECAEQEILQRGLGGACPAAIKPGEHVDRERHELDAEKDQHQVARADEQQHAGRRE